MMPYSVFDMETAKSIKQIFDLGEQALWGEFVNAIGTDLNLTTEQRGKLLAVADDYACRAFNEYAAPILTRLTPRRKSQDIICP